MGTTPPAEPNSMKRENEKKMNTISHAASRIINLLLLATVSIVVPSCTGGTMNGNCDRDFSSIGEEQDYWNEWKKSHGSSRCHLEPFFWKCELDLWKQVNERVVAIAKASDVFVLIVQTNVYLRRLEVLVLARDGSWQGVKWEKEDGILKQSALKTSTIDENVLNLLSCKRVFVSASDRTTDADSVYVFLRYGRKCSRYAIYNPDVALRKEPQGDPVVVSLESLLRIAGMAYNTTEETGRGEIEELSELRKRLRGEEGSGEKTER